MNSCHTGGRCIFFAPSKQRSSPYINHFIQPDTIIPDPTSTQAWNRYSYVGNRPVNFNDPTGHDMVCAGPSGNSNYCYDDGNSTTTPNDLPKPSEVTGSTLTSYLEKMEKKYGILPLPDGFQWDIWEGDLPPPYDEQSPDGVYGVAVGYEDIVGNNGQKLYALHVYLDTSAFANLNEVEFASNMIHESRHAWIMYLEFSGELERLGIKLPIGGDPANGSYKSLLFEADAYHVQADFLAKYDITSTDNLGNPEEVSQSYIKELKYIYNISSLPFQVPLGVCQPIWC